jgi:hypothetical protein
MVIEANHFHSHLISYSYSIFFLFLIVVAEWSTYNNNNNNSTMLMTIMTEKSQKTSGSTKKAKSKKESESRASRNITFLVISTSLLYAVGTLPYTISYILSSAGSSAPLEYRRFAVFMLFFSHGSNIFIYFSFNKLYRGILFEYIKNIFRFKRSKNIS